MKLPTDNLRLGDSLGSLFKALHQVLPMIARQVNDTSEGRIHGAHNALAAAPTTGTYSQGDYIRNKAPEVLGTAGSQYVVKGWICVDSGTPGTWVEDRGVTGT